MPVYNGMLKHIDTDRVRDLASQRGTTDVSTEDIETICDRVVSLATPKSVFYQFYYEPSTHTILCNDPFDVEGATVQSYLDRTEVVIMMASTIGKAVEDEVDALFLQKNSIKALSWTRPLPLLRSRSSTSCVATSMALAHQKDIKLSGACHQEWKISRSVSKLILPEPY